MKKFSIIFILLIIPAATFAKTIILNPPVAVSSPEAHYLDWRVTRLDSVSLELGAKVRYRDADGRTIMQPGGDSTGWITWTCRDVPIPGENTDCVGAGDPYECCTGEGTGTCDGYSSTCFSDIFGFVIRTQDAGTTLGIGLQTLIENKIKADFIP